ACRRRAVRGSVVDVEGSGSASASYCEGGDLGSSVALGNGDVADRDVADAPRGVGVGDGANALALDDGAAVGRAQQVDEKRLIGFDGRVTVDGHRNGLAKIAGGEAHRACWLRDIVAAGRCRAVGRGIADVEGCGSAGSSYCEGGDLGSSVALGNGDVVDRDVADAPRGVVVGDGANALALDDGAAVGRAQQVDEKRLIGFDGRVTVDGHRNGLAKIAGGEAHRACWLRDIGAAGPCRAVGRGIADVEGCGSAGSSYCEGGDLGSSVALGNGDVVDRD